LPDGNLTEFTKRTSIGYQQSLLQSGGGTVVLVWLRCNPSENLDCDGMEHN